MPLELPKPHAEKRREAKVLPFQERTTATAGFQYSGEYPFEETESRTPQDTDVF